MGYLKIPNLHSNRTILLFRECWALQKIHGTSTHFGFNEERGLFFFSGGEKHENFIKLFDHDFLRSKFEELGLTNITIYGEGYGGKQQGMKDIYGPDLKFVAFDVKIGDRWLCVPEAERFCTQFNVEFVHYWRTSTNTDMLNMLRDVSSMQAIRNGMGPGKPEEGIVLRPIIELTGNNGKRIICKHKRDDFRETLSKRKVTQTEEEIAVLEKTNEIVDEYCVPMRLSHVLGKIPDPSEKDIPQIIHDMVEDIRIEAEGEVVWNKYLRKAIGKRTVELFKQYLANKLKN